MLRIVKLIRFWRGQAPGRWAEAADDQGQCGVQSVKTEIPKQQIKSSTELPLWLTRRMHCLTTIMIAQLALDRSITARIRCGHLLFACAAIGRRTLASLNPPGRST